MDAEAAKRDAAPAPPPVAPSAAGPPAMRGITVGALKEPPAGSRPEDIRHAIQGQVLAGALLAAGLLPPVLTALVLGLSQRARSIPSSSVWAWSATVLALIAAALSALRPIRRRGPAVAGTWIRPLLVGLLVLAPAAAVLYLRLTVPTITLPLVAAQIALYVLSLFVLFFSALPASE